MFTLNFIVPTVVQHLAFCGYTPGASPNWKKQMGKSKSIQFHQRGAGNLTERSLCFNHKVSSLIKELTLKNRSHRLVGAGMLCLGGMSGNWTTLFPHCPLTCGLSGLNSRSEKTLGAQAPFFTMAWSWSMNWKAPELYLQNYGGKDFLLIERGSSACVRWPSP